MAINKFAVRVDMGGSNTLVRSAPEYVDARVLLGAGAEVITVPTGADLVVFSSTGNFYARPNNAAAIPAADVTDGTGSELNPTAWQLRPLGATPGTAITTIGIIASADAVVTLAWYKHQ